MRKECALVANVCSTLPDDCWVEARFVGATSSRATKGFQIYCQTDVRAEISEEQLRETSQRRPPQHQRADALCGSITAPAAAAGRHAPPAAAAAATAGAGAGGAAAAGAAERAAATAAGGEAAAPAPLPAAAACRRDPPSRSCRCSRCLARSCRRLEFPWPAPPCGKQPHLLPRLPRPQNEQRARWGCGPMQRRQLRQREGTAAREAVE